MEDRDCPRTLPTNSHVILAIQPPYKVGSIVFMSHMRKPQAITSISHYRKRFRGENSPLSRVQARFPHVKAYVPDFLTSNIDGGGISEHPRWHKTYQNCMRTESLPENSCSFYTLHDNICFFSSSYLPVKLTYQKYVPNISYASLKEYITPSYLLKRQKAHKAINQSFQVLRSTRRSEHGVNGTPSIRM